MNENIQKYQIRKSDSSYQLSVKDHFKDFLRFLYLSKNGLLGRSSNGPKRFVIFGQGSCGKTLLTSCLNSNPEIRCKGELLFRRHLLPISYVEYFVQDAGLEFQAYGFELKPWHITRVLKREPRIFMKRLEDAGYVFIHLVRNNVFLQSLSQVNRFSRGIVHTSSKEKVQKDLCEIDVEYLIYLMRSMIYLRRLENYGLASITNPFIEIEYESNLQFQCDHQNICNIIFEFLGLKRSIVSSSLRKVYPHNWRHGVSNAQEIELALVDAGFGDFIEMGDDL